MKGSKLMFAVCVMVLINVGACNSAKQEASATGSQAQPVVAKAQVDGAMSGKVVETMNSGGYTYVSLEKNGKKTWVAVPQADVKVGQELACQPGMEMKNFTSKTLKRTFDSIIFSGGIL